MYSVIEKIEHEVNHHMPVEKIAQRVQEYVKNKNNLGAMSSAYKRWNRELASLGLNAHRIMNTAGNTHLHDLRLTAAHTQPLYKVFQQKR